MLQINDLTVKYGALVAVRELSLTVHEGEIVTLIGANGAGKSSTLNAIMGLVPAASGQMSWGGKDITRLRAYKRVQNGITLCPEGRGMLTSLTVQENLELGGFLHMRKSDNAARIKTMYERFPRLAERRTQLAGTLSGGEQQILAVARALLCRPRLLLLDEPSLGLAPMTAAEVMQTVKDIGAEGVGVLLVEQNVNHALRVADNAYVMESGAVVLKGPAADLLEDDRVRGAYLGGLN